MSTRFVIFLAAIASLAAVITVVVLSSGSDHETAEQRRDRCLYSAIEQAPTIPEGTSAFEVVPDCKGLPKSDQKQLQEIMVAFVSNAFDRAAAG